MAFRGLQAESVAQGQAHKSIAKELETLVADPFEDWARGYAERIKKNKTTVLDNWLKSYEQAHGEVSKLKHQYLAKTRRADEAEDDAKFAPNSNVPDNYTSSPRMRPVDSRTPPARTASVSERISQRLKEIQKKSGGALNSALNGEDSEAPVPPKIDKGKGKAIDPELEPPIIASPPPMSPLLPPPRTEIPSSPFPPMPPPPILLAGLSLPPVAVSQLLTRAAAELPLRPVRFPLLGEYPDCFSGDEFVSWLNENVQGFGGSIDLAEDAARELTEREGLLRRIGEFGNQFENADDAYYQFRPKAFDLEGTKSAEQNGVSPSNSAKSLQPENLMKRTGNLVNLVSKVLNTAGGSGEPAYVRARNDADEADRAYRIAVRKLDRQRLGLEERLEEILKVLQRWETERLRAVKTVLLQYQGTLANLPKTLEPSIERQAVLVASYLPENDLTALIERYRTGPFRPRAQVYESVAHDESDVVFGIDLRKWAEGGWHALTTGEEKKELVPPVLTALLGGLEEAYGRLPNDAEKRKSWIYEVPLPAVHHLREALNAVPPEEPLTSDLVAKYDAPVVASALKLWILELDPPIALYEGWDDLRRLYPTVGSSAVEQDPEEHTQAVGAALQRLPRVHLYVLDAVVKHLKTLIENTVVEEPDEVYITKLALSIGRAIVRPKVESELSIQDRHPTLLFIDLMKNYDAILPPTISRKKRESERRVPIRKRTAPVDMRLSRSRISIGADAKQLLAAQQIAQNPSLVKGNAKSPERPPLPPPINLASPPPPPPALRQSPISASPTSPIVPPPPPPILTPPPPPQVLVPPPPPPAQVISAIRTPPPPPPLVSSSPSSDRPTFREPPPEFDEEPTRPAFREPSPELDYEDSPPTRPNFVEPPVEEDEAPSPAPPNRSPIPSRQSPTTTVIPPTPQKRFSVSSGRGSPVPSPSSNKFTSRSPTPPEDQPLSNARSTLSRTSSAQSQATGVRGPRLARGPRPPSVVGGGSVSSMISNINRNSMTGGGTSSPAGSGISRSTNRLSGSPVRRPSSVLGRSAAFSRRTMASDAEDDIVDRK
ncbi:hypothetical protein H0H81_002332 [Sphagnurus paluster]|uniref:Uncharacterized protein n=1 Tax=Sphagnurus paluster TaxID=117069 RepID=A0A9P7GI58_9AGAR|nr:hypothetical protein H0H81_002332 [Sphagnurus paluster]